MRRFQCIILVASVGLLAVSAAPLTGVNTKPSKAVSGGGGSDRDHVLAPIDNAIKTESAEEEQRQRNFFLPQSLVPPPPAAAAAAKADVKQSKKPKVVDPDNREFVTGHRIPPEIIERRNKAAAYVDSSSFRQEAVASPLPPLPPPSLLDYALLSDEGDHAFFSTRDSFVPDYEFEY